MNRIHAAFSFVALLACSAGPALSRCGQPASNPDEQAARPLVLRAGRVLPVTGPEIAGGMVIVRDGCIASVGASATLAPPDGALVIDMPGAWLVPGFVDLHCHVAGTDLNDMSVPVNPDLSVRDQVVPRNELLLDGLAGGVTTVLFIPGSGTNLSGFGILLDAGGRDLSEMVMRDPGAMKIAQAGNPERRSGEVGRGRMGMNWNLREALTEGRDYDLAWSRWEAEKHGAPPERVERLQAMRGLFHHQFPVIVHTQWAPVFESSIRMLVDEFHLWVILSHTEFDSFQADALVVKRGLPLNVGPRGYHVDFDTGEIVGLAARHHEEGVQSLSLNTDSPVVPEQELPFQAAIAVRYGLPWADALRGLTIEPARQVGVGDRVGSIEAGKEADLVFWTGDPLDPRSHVLLAITDGRIALDQRSGVRRW